MPLLPHPSLRGAGAAVLPPARRARRHGAQHRGTYRQLTTGMTVNSCRMPALVEQEKLDQRQREQRMPRHVHITQYETKGGSGLEPAGATFLAGTVGEQLLDPSHVGRPDGMSAAPEALRPEQLYFVVDSATTEQDVAVSAFARGAQTKDSMLRYRVSHHVVLYHAATGSRVELVPLFLTCVSRWYVKHLIALVSSKERFSTVYLTVPWITTVTSGDAPKRRSWSTRLALDVSLTNDFPAAIPLPDPRRAPVFSCASTAKEWLLARAGRPAAGDGVATLAASLAAGAHSKDTVAVVGNPRELLRVAAALRASDGWSVVSARPMHIALNAHRTYGMWVHGLHRTFVALAIILSIVYFEAIERYCRNSWEKQMNWAATCTAPDTNDAGAIPVEDVQYYSIAYAPEQDVMLQKLRRFILTEGHGGEGSERGAGTDKRPDRINMFERTGVKPIDTTDGYLFGFGWLNGKIPPLPGSRLPADNPFGTLEDSIQQQAEDRVAKEAFAISGAEFGGGDAAGGAAKAA